MPQISAPLRIAFGAIIVLALVWFVALRPKGADEEPAAVTPPGVEGLANSVSKARSAKEAADAAVKRSEQAVAGVDESSAGTGAATKSGSKSASRSAQAGQGKGAGTSSKGKPGGRSAELVRALDRGKAVVILFRNRSTDSAHVAKVVRGIYKRKGLVVTEVASAKHVARYSAFTNKTAVSQAPTTFIVGPTRRAVVIAGYTSTGEVDQAIGDVLGRGSAEQGRIDAAYDAAARQAKRDARRTCGTKASGADCRAYFASVNRACVDSQAGGFSSLIDDLLDSKTPARSMRRYESRYGRMITRISAAPHPAGQNAAHKRLVAMLRKEKAGIRSGINQIKGKPLGVQLLKADAAFSAASTTYAGNKASKRSMGFDACAPKSV